jgi:tetratricopeptide (TPR) repeat protein
MQGGNVNNVHHLAARSGSLEDAQRHFAAARFSHALTALRDLNTAPAATLRMRAQLRLGELDRAVGTFDAVRESLEHRESDDPETGLCYAWGARAAYRFGDRAKARLLVEKALACVTASSPPAFAEVSYIAATIVAERFEDVERLLQPALRSDIPSLQCYAHEYLAIQQEAGGRRDEAFASFLAAWEAIKTDHHTDEYLASCALVNLSVHALYRLDINTLQHAAERLQDLEWSAEPLHSWRAVMVSALAAKGCALSGNTLQAFSILRESQHYARTDAGRVFMLATRACIAHDLGEPLFASEELHQALSVAQFVDWESTTGQERMALLELADSAARTRHAEASAFFARFIRARPGMPNNVYYSVEPSKALAFEGRVAGIIALRQSDTATGIALLQRAFDDFVAVGILYYPCTIALELAEVGAAQKSHIEFLRSHVESIPNSWIAKRARALPDWNTAR